MASACRGINPAERGFEGNTIIKPRGLPEFMVAFPTLLIQDLPAFLPG